MSRFSFKEEIRTLSPVFFALPMSTGIVSIVSYYMGFEKISDVLYLISNIELAVLALFLLGRILFYFPDFKKDLSCSREGAGFLTIVAALCIYGTKNVLIKDNLNMALFGWTLTFAIWLLLIFSFYVMATVRKEKKLFKDAVSGRWLLFVVSTQALSISGNLAGTHFDFNINLVLLITTALFLLGAVFYLIIISIIFYRMAFLSFGPMDFKPSYWINMGAAAITTLAGGILIQSMGDVPQFVEYIPVMKVFTLLFWIAGTWWIPIIIALEIWKNLSAKVRFTPGYWSVVFPLGMYTLCTWVMADVLNLPFLKYISETSIYIAWGAWLFTYILMIKWMIGKVIAKR